LRFRGDAPMGYLLTLYPGLGVILGHNYPFYLKFQGGKGIAATAGILTSLDLRLMVICLISFVLVVAVSRYVSLGSLVVAVIFLVWNWVMAGSYGSPQAGVTDYYIGAAAISALGVWRHKANIIRLAHGTENKLWGSKK
ncbi:MAG: glycerol-3-phosphate acyltransferase, partial [Clostridium sp.]|nr:glycerol-3-phosphate acyltransferase [Clostridium sp.]